MQTLSSHPVPLRTHLFLFKVANSNAINRNVSKKPFQVCHCRKLSLFPPTTYTIVFVRHGQSEWNKSNQFCGWHDAPLSDEGRKEAMKAGRDLRRIKFKFDAAYSSVLTCSVETMRIILAEMGLSGQIPHVQHWRLNERHYGNLTGLNKAATVEKFGRKQVMQWRRSFATPPPDIKPDNPYYKQIVDDPKYAGVEIPKAESLKDTVRRVFPLWNDVLAGEIRNGRKVIVSAHGNSLRAIVKHLDGISDEAIMSLDLPTGIPFVYELDEHLKPVPGKSMRFVGDVDTVRKAIEKVRKETEFKR